MRTTNSSIGRLARSLMFKDPRLLKEHQFKYGVTMVQRLKDGMFSILTRKERQRLRD
jgi:hypothetical protein